MDEQGWHSTLGRQYRLGAFCSLGDSVMIELEHAFIDQVQWQLQIKLLKLNNLD
jgi:hypothetical protein